MSEQLTCPECHGHTCYPSSVPGLASCNHCGMVFPLPEDWDPVEAESDDGWEILEGLVGDIDITIPDEIGVVEGWRAWSVQAGSDGPPLLQSVTYSGAHWTPRQVTVATCAVGGGRANGGRGKPKHEVPDEHCRCGLYAAKNRDHLLGMHYPSYDAETGLWTVIGKVALWGKVIEGSQGWRAGKGYPQELYVPYEAVSDLAEPLERAYGIEVAPDNWLAPIGEDN